MSERMDADLERFIASRLVTGIDVLPVPAGPGRMPPRDAAPTRWEPTVIFAVVFAIVTITIAWAPATQAVADAAKLIQRMITGAPYVGYYVQLHQRDADGRQVMRVMFAPGHLPGIRAVPDVVAPNVVYRTGPSAGFDRRWTDAGELLIWARQRIYVGDGRGQLREIADLGSDYTVLRATWTGPGDVIALLGDPPGVPGEHRWLTRIGIGRAPETPRQISSFTNPWEFPFVSPDGRWMQIDRGNGVCAATSGLYEIDTGRRLDLVDQATRPLTAIGWMPDGRLVTAHCDEGRATMELFIAPSDAVPSTPIAVIPWTVATPRPVIDAARDRILVAPRGGTDPATLIAIGPDGRRSEIGRIPAFTSRPDSYSMLLNLSRDERFLSFFLDTEFNDKTGDGGFRTGVIELATGQVTYACSEAEECYHLTLR